MQPMLRARAGTQQLECERRFPLYGVTTVLPLPRLFRCSYNVVRGLASADVAGIRIVLLPLLPFGQYGTCRTVSLE